jgi:hypothetical protein
MKPPNMPFPEADADDDTRSGIVKPAAFTQKPSSAEDRVLRKMDKLEERIAKLEGSQFDSSKTDRDLQKFKKDATAGFKKASQSYIKLNSKVDSLASDVAFDRDNRTSGPSIEHNLSTAPSAESWEASKKAAELVDARTKAAVRAQIREHEGDFKLDDIASSPPVQGAGGMQRSSASPKEEIAPSMPPKLGVKPGTNDPTPTKNQANAPTLPGTNDSSPTKNEAKKLIESLPPTQDDDVAMDDEEGTVIPDSQQNAQKEDFIHPLVNYSSDDSAE